MKTKFSRIAHYIAWSFVLLFIFAIVIVVIDQWSFVKPLVDNPKNMYRYFIQMQTETMEETRKVYFYLEDGTVFSTCCHYSHLEDWKYYIQRVQVSNDCSYTDRFLDIFSESEKFIPSDSLTIRLNPNLPVETYYDGDYHEGGRTGKEVVKILFSNAEPIGMKLATEWKFGHPQVLWEK